MTSEEFTKLFGCDPEECEQDNDGQLIIYTGVYMLEDGSLSDIPPEDSEGDS